MIRIAHKFFILDTPDNGLKSHKSPTPYLGGVAVYVSFMATFFLVVAPYVNNLCLFVLGTLLLLLIGLVDDLIALKPQHKLYGQLIAALCFLWGGYYLKDCFFVQNNSGLGLFLCLMISLFWIIAIINAFNLIDVMDGLATSVACLVSISFFISALLLHVPYVALSLASFIGSLIGFLFYNKPPARIYLGDAGSLLIGGLLAVISFMIPWGTYNQYGYFAPIILLGIPLIEVFTLIIIRWRKNIPFYLGSPDHFCHYFIAKGWSKRKILGYVACWNVILLLLGIFFVFNYLSFLLMIVCSIALFILWYYFLWYY